MPQKSTKRGIEVAEIPEEQREDDALSISSDELTQHFQQDSVSISLKYYQKSCECFSKWARPELKKFASTVEKIRGYEPDQLKAAKSLCDMHKGAPSKDRFKRPQEISEDIKFYEIKVDPRNKARIHGFFVQGVFFLVWLDRDHSCFPQ